jgi:hypothetical protein
MIGAGTVRYPKALSVEVARPYVIEVTFDDGARRRLDLESELWGEAFAPLRDPDLFAQVGADPDWGTIVWSTGADLSPEFIHEASTLVEPGGAAGERTRRPVER